MKLPISIVTAAVVLALTGCATEGPVFATGTNSPTSDESMPAPGDRSTSSGRPVEGPGGASSGTSSSGSSAGTSSPTADESKQAPGDHSNSTGTTESITPQ